MTEQCLGQTAVSKGGDGHSIIEIMIENRDEFKSEKYLPLAQMVKHRLQKLGPLDKYPELDLKKDFMELFFDNQNI